MSTHAKVAVGTTINPDDRAEIQECMEATGLSEASVLRMIIRQWALARRRERGE